MSKVSNEPVVSLVLGLVAAGVAVLVAFGVDISPEQGAAIAGFAVAAFGLGLYVRSKVTPVKASRRRRKTDAGLSMLEVLVILLVVAVVLILVGVL